MSFAQVYGSMMCAAVAILGCADGRDPRGGAGPLAPGEARAAARTLTTGTSTPSTVALVGGDGDPPAVVTGFTQGAHGTVSLSGATATYQPAAGYEGADRFTYTLTGRDGAISSATVEVAVQRVAPACAIAIEVPAAAVIGSRIPLQAHASCNIGTPEIQWWYQVRDARGRGDDEDRDDDRPRVALGAPGADAEQVLDTGRLRPGTYQIHAEVRPHGSRATFVSRTAELVLGHAAARCPEIALAAPVNGAVAPVGAPLGLEATPGCLAGASAEYQFWVRPEGLPFWIPVTGFRTAPASFAPPFQGRWQLTAVVRTRGSRVPFEAVAAPVTVTATLGPLAVDDALAIDEDTTGAVNVLANDLNPRGGALVARLTRAPVAGTASMTGGIVSYAPAANYHGDDTISYTITDRRGRSSSASVRITVRSVNDAPVAAADRLAVNQGSAASLDVTTNDRDVDGDPLTVTAVSPPGHGTATFAGAIVSYAPDADYSGPDAFTYTISDGQGGTASAEVAIDVIAGGSGNAPPVAADDALELAEDTEAGLYVLANDSDPDGDPLIVSVDQPAHGAVTVVAGFASYRPAPDFFGDDAFRYTVQDPGGLTATATVHVTVLPVNDPPIARDDSASLDEDTSVVIDVVADDLDADGDALTVASVTEPAHGTAVIVSGHELRYTPAADFNGVDTFSYAVADPSGATASATVTVAVAEVNDPPVAVDDAATLDEDTGATLDLVANDRDVDGDPLAITELTQPAHGRAELVDEHHVRYTPDPEFHGADAFGYTIGDGSGAQATASVALTVTSVNDPPVAADDAATLDEDSAATIDVLGNDRDADGDVLAVASVTQPAHGVAEVLETGQLRYTPGADFHGADAFSYTVSDGSGGQATAAVALTVIAVNDAPVARADAASLAEDAAAVIDVVANDLDVDGDALAIVAVTQPASGVVAVIDAHHVSYTPAPDFHGEDAFGYTIADPSGATASAVVAVVVVPVNDPPIAAADAASVDEDGALTVDVVANDLDVDGDPLVIIGIGQPAHGLATIVDGHRVQYTPAPDYHGPDALSYTIGDGHGGEATGALAIEVIGVNDPPVAVDDAASLDEDTALTLDVVANDRDVDGDGLTIVRLTQPAHGAAAVVDGHRVSYTPAANYHGPDGFSYTIVDPSGAEATASVALAVLGVNDPPIAVADAASVDEDATLTIDVVANDLDVDGDALAIVDLGQPAHGLATVVDGHHVLYAPAPNYHGPDALSYTISDGHGGQATGELTLDVISVNDAPVATDDAGQLAEDDALTLDVAANDLDVDGDALAIASVTQPAHGTATVVDVHHVLYTPAADFHGADGFSYTISDGHGGQATAAVALEVTPVNDPPVAVDDTASLDEDGAITIDVVANDRDVDGDALAVITVSAPAHGAAVVVDAHHVRYTPIADYHGPDALQYAIADGAGGQASATVTLDVISVNDAPVAAPVAVATFDDTSVAVTLVATDVDGDALSYAIATPPAHGTLGAVAGNRVTYTPAPGFAGADAFSYVAFDGQASSVAAPVSVTVTRSVCGNGVAEGREECDDGNGAGGDGCEVTCKLTCGSGTGADRASVDPVSGHCFAAYDGVRHSYQDGAAMCAGFGGHLPTITSAGEDAAALAAVQVGDSPWLGGDDVAIEGTFGWLTGEAFAGYGHFAAGKPDDAGGADCLRYTNDGSWTDAACASEAGALCEFELATSTPAFATGGAGARAVAVVDVNDDGFADLAVANATTNTVGVLLGNGAGGFVLRATVAAGAAPSAIAAGDLDGDGHPDLAVLNPTANTVTVLRGSATGAFTAGGTVAVAAGATALAIGDFDQDGRPDLAIAATGAVQVLRGNGTGGFAPLTSVAILGAPAAITAGDFDGDGRADLAVTTSTVVVVVLAVGPGGFAAPLVVATVPGSRGVVATDLDRDGRLDLAVAGSAGLTVWFGGAIGFSAPLAIPVAGAPALIAAGDFDGDGHPDLVAATTGSATLLRGAGRTFSPLGPAISTGGTGASALAVAALDRDGAQDLVVANATSATAGVLRGGPAGFAGARTLAFGTSTASTVAADWNADGRADLAVIDPGTSTAGVFLQTASGTLVQSATITLLANSGSSFGAAADFDGDGKLDLAIVNVNFSSVSVALGAGNGAFGAPLTTGVAQSPRRPAVGDFNGDGRPDLAVPAAIGNAVTILANTGAGRFGRVADLAVTGAPGAVAIGDWNGDGRPDLAVATTGEASVKVLLGRGGGAFGPPTAFAVAAGGQAIAAGDLDGDGRLDLVATTTTTGGISVLFGAGTGAFGPPTSVATGAQPSSVAIADLDGDGRLDVVVGDAGSADVCVLHNAGAGALSASSVSTGVATAFVTIADLDRDGHLDITVASPNPFVTTLPSGR